MTEQTAKPKTEKVRTRKTTSTRKPAAAKTKAKTQSQFESVSETMKKAVYAQLGLIGTFYDNVSEIRDNVDQQLVKVRKQAPKQWQGLVKRGERVERDLRNTQDELQKRIEEINLIGDFEQNVEKVRESLGKVRDRFSKAA